MELDSLVTKDLANEGVWFPVKLYGRPLDFDLLILGDDSDIVQQYNRQALKKMKRLMGKSINSNYSELDDNTVDEMVDSNDEAVLVRIVGIRGWKVERNGSKEIGRQPEPVTLNGKEIKADNGSLKLLIGKIPALKEFVLDVARERTNFLSQRSGN